jgi:hypothetical protein
MKTEDEIPYIPILLHISSSRPPAYIQKVLQLSHEEQDTLLQVGGEVLDLYQKIRIISTKYDKDKEKENEDAIKQKHDLIKDLWKQEKENIEAEIERRSHAKMASLEEWKTYWKQENDQQKRRTQEIETLLKQKEEERTLLEKELLLLRQEQQYKNAEYENHVERKVAERLQEYRDTIHSLTQRENETIRRFQEEKAELQSKMATLHIEKERRENRVLVENLSLIQRDMEEIKKTQTQQALSNHRGAIGENYFEGLATDLFGGLDLFEIVETKKTPHSGDYHLHFREFSIMVDIKNYVASSGVSKDEVRKLKEDMKKNPRFRIAWMVSLDKPIHGYNENDATVMTKIENGIGYCFINSLGRYDEKEQKRILKTCWYYCKEMDALLRDEKEAFLLDKYKKKENRVREIAERMLKDIKTGYSTLKLMKENLQAQEKSVNDILKDEIMTIQEIHTETVRKWWEERYVRVIDTDTGSGSPTSNKRQGQGLKSNKLYEEFNRMNEGRLENDTFKLVLRAVIDDEELIEMAGKSTKAQMIIWGYTCK